MKRFRRVNNIVGWIVFVLASIVYLSTMEPTVSLWDCGEFIAGAYKLQVVHPPGAPFFLMLGRMFTLFAGDAANVAMMVNAMSALSSAFAVLFLFWIITGFAKEIVLENKEKVVPLDQLVAIMGAGAVGAAAGCFADSFWFSAVEGEVYALSSFFTMFVFWAILKWKTIAHQPYSDRWLIFIAFMMGLSIGVHLLNLLTIPAIVFVYYFKKFEASRAGIIKAFLVGVAILGFVQYGIITWFLPTAMAKIELLFVNTFGLPFNSGVIFFIGALIAAIVWGLRYTYVKNRPVLNTALLCLTFILLGYSTYTMVVIRSNANPSIDMNNPEDPFSLQSYLSREQYGSSPLLYGHYFTASVKEQEKGAKKYFKGKDKYEVKGYKVNQIYDDDHKTFFPRIWNNRQQKYVRFYRNWLNLDKGEKPDQGDNISFFVSYQLGWMYWRYFMWNFSGRQNDKQGHGSYKNGNWISGISFVDEPRIGPQDNLPASMKNNPGYNRFYMLPFILGLIGMFYHFNKEKKGATIVSLLFFFTGIAIVIYLNQEPLQPRERDYSYAGSFLAYAIWIGIGTLGVFEFLKKKIRNIPGIANAGIAILICAIPPYLMGTEGWDDHDRSDRYAARDFAVNYLQSCPKNAILFTQGDNDTYPLWYAQEVEGIRTDVRIVNLSLLSVDWYIDQLKRAKNDAAGVPFSMSSDKYRGNTRDYLPFHPYFNNKKLPQNRYYNLKKIMQIVSSNDNSTRVRSRNGKHIDYLPARQFKLPVNKQKVIKAGAVPEEKQDEIESVMKWKMPKKHLIKSDMMLLDLIAQNDWQRPICFAVSVSPSAFLGLKKYFQLEGLVYRLVPIENQMQGQRIENINTDVMYEHVMNDFRWGKVAEPGKYMDENLRRMAMNLRIQVNQLARSLIQEGKKEAAVRVLDKCVQALPHENVPYNMVMMQTAELYYKAGANEKARPIAKKVFELFADDVRYYASLKQNAQEYFQAYSQDFQRAVRGILPRIMNIAKQHNDKALLDTIRPQFNALQQQVSASFGGQ